MSEQKECEWKCARCKTINTGKRCTQCGVKCTNIPQDIQLFCFKDKRLKDKPPRHAGWIGKPRDLAKPITEKLTEPELAGELEYERKVYYKGRDSKDIIEVREKGKPKLPLYYSDCKLILDENGEPYELQRFNKDYDPTSPKNPRYWYWRIVIKGKVQANPEGIEAN